MIDRNLLKYPEQLAARLTQMENDINTVKRRGGKVIANGGGGGGSDITVVQTTGTSTTKVMSQNAVTVALGDKVDKVSGKGLSSNDYTTADKNKLADIEAGAQVNDIEVIKKNGTALPISSKTVDIAVPTKTSDLTNDAGFITSSYHDSTKQNLIADALLTAGTQSTNKTVNTYSINTPSLIPSSSTSGQKTTAFDMATTSTAGMMSGTDKTNLDNTVSYIPSQASSTNQLADKDFVNSSINSVTAYYITKNASGEQFNTKAELNNATVFYSGGEVRVPTRNDYCVVLEDESKRDPDSGQDPTTRYIYQNGQWEYQYTINATAFTAAQLAALNSGITSVKVTKLNGIENGAQINVLEGVQLNGVDQTVTNKKVNIPVANDSNIGVSKLYSYTGHSNDGSMDQNTVTTTFIQSEDPVSIPTIADVSTSRIVEGAVTTSKIADGAVTTAKIVDGAITNDKIEDGSITFNKIEPHIEITKTLAVNTEWTDTGISGTNLATGVYVVAAYNNNGSNTGLYHETYAGIMSWYSANTNSSNSCEILLHNSGHADNSQRLFLRTLRNASGVLKLQYAFKNSSSTSTTVVFKFRRII